MYAGTYLLMSRALIYLLANSEQRIPCVSLTCTCNRGDDDDAGLEKKM